MSPFYTRVTGASLAILAFVVQLSAAPVLITAPKTIGPLDSSIVPSAGGAAIPLDQAEIRVVGTTLTINGRHLIRSLSIERSAGNVAGSVTHAGGFSYDYSGGAGPDLVFGLWLDVAGDVVVQGKDGALVASSIDTTARGYGASQGPGAVPGGGCCGGGGGAAHAGNAGNGREFAGSTSTYGSVTQPSQLGSGGGNVWGQNVGGSGGGAVRLNVGGTLTVDGVIKNEGGAGRQGGSADGGGGSGGSTWVEASSFSGAGLISTNGGAGGTSIAGGGGGGRIAIYCGSNQFGGQITSTGGGVVGRQGGAGTVYVARTGSLPVLRIDNQGIAGATTDINEPLVLDADLEVGPGARVSHGTGRLTGLMLDFAGDVTIEVGGSIDVTARGYGASQGPGAVPGGGCCGGGGGAAHAGNAG
ncbi:MAG: hypothetical protein JNK16_12365, partial [Phycisphaerales bacterium]|nr:hypothetical protein [Phycisphaerales bacterium]